MQQTDTVEDLAFQEHHLFCNEMHLEVTQVKTQTYLKYIQIY